MRCTDRAKLKGRIQNGCVIPMAISKRAKARMKIMSASEKASVKKAAKLLFDCELMGAKRMQEIMRWASK